MKPVNDVSGPCMVETFVVPSSVSPFWSTTGQSRCLAHRWDWPPGQPIGANDLCPLGRIEQATAEALAAIAAAKRQV